MRFSRLDGCSIPVFAIGFRIEDSFADPWTERFNQFKFGHATRQSAAIKGACATLPAAIMSAGLPTSATIVSAIGSADVTLDVKSPLAKLGIAVAARTGWDWQPGVLQKRAHQSLKTLRSAEDRDAMVGGVYTAGAVQAATIVILDDFATRGSTIEDIARALRTRQPTIELYGVVLAKNERIEWSERLGQPVSNGHIPRRLEDLWDTE